MADIVSTTRMTAQDTMANELGMGPIEVLVPDRLYALQNVITLDGRISSYPANARGFTVSNCYLIKEGKDAVLLDSGYSAHERSLLAQIEHLLEPDATLSVYPLRINEYMSVCNVEAIAARFNVIQCYSGNPDAALWVDFGGRSDSTGQAAEAVRPQDDARRPQADTLCRPRQIPCHRGLSSADPTDRDALDL